MSRRSALRSDLAQAWRKTIQNEYNKRLINGEASLQAHFIKHLAKVFETSGKDRSIFVEPSFRLIKGQQEGEDRYVPDLVLCSARQVIGLVEFKYAPKGDPAIKRDLKKLGHLFSARKRDHENGSDGLYLQAHRYLGPTKEAKFNFSSDLLLVYAAVHRGNKNWHEKKKDALDNSALEYLLPSVFLLGAETSPTEEPLIWQQRGRGNRKPVPINDPSPD